MSAYFLWHNRIVDTEKMKEYLSKALATMAPYDPEVVVFDEHAHCLEGSTPGPRTIVIKFPSRDNALAWYNSAAYQAFLPLRLAATEGFGVLVDGYAPAGS